MSINLKLGKQLSSKAEIQTFRSVFLEILFHFCTINNLVHMLTLFSLLKLIHMIVV